jgi:hypothetical protein
MYIQLVEYVKPSFMVLSHTGLASLLNHLVAAMTCENDLKALLVSSDKPLFSRFTAN